MSLFLITGLPGSGKSTVWSELKSRGYEAYDGDYDGLAKWYSTKTGLAVEKKDEQRTAEFGRTHSRDIKRQKVEGLVVRAQDKPIFLCGDPENEDELRDLFFKVFALVIDEDTRTQRLTSRTNNSWGKLPHERERDQIFRQKAQKTYPKYRYIILDATQPTAHLVNQILAEI